MVFFFRFKCALFSLSPHDFGGKLVTALHTCSPPASFPDTPYMSWRWGGGGVGQGVAPLWQQQRQKSNWDGRRVGCKSFAKMCQLPGTRRLVRQPGFLGSSQSPQTFSFMTQALLSGLAGRISCCSKSKVSGWYPPLLKD